VKPDGEFAQRVTIGRGVRGTKESLEIAARLAAGALLDPRFALFARRKLITEPGTDPRDVRRVFQNIFDYVKANVGYQPDPLVFTDPATGESVSDYIQSPHWTLLIEGLGDCLAHATLAGSLAAALGHGFGFKTLKMDPAEPDRFSHVYAVLGYRDPSSGSPIWLPADTTVPRGDLGDEVDDIWRFSPRFFQVAEAI
jgi:hypothetical protein